MVLKTSLACCVKSLKLYNFRNYLNSELNCDGLSVVIVGNNGVGKTNILEAVSLLSKGKGIRSANASEMRNSSTNIDWVAHYDFCDGNNLNSIGIASKQERKLISINGKMQSNYSLLSELSDVIWFAPQMDYILLKGPGTRLKFFDRIVSTFKEKYALYFIKYKRAKSERSRLLKENILDDSWLTGLEDIMASCGTHISLMRFSVLQMLQETINQDLSTSLPKPALQLITQLPKEKDFDKIVSHYKDYLRQSRGKDSLYNRVSFGVHNDNFQIFHQQKQLASNLCSTGEQKLLLLSTVMASVRARQTSPILLLDDVMSHLDKRYREAILEEILNIGCQTWVSDVNDQNFLGHKESFKFFTVKDDQILNYD
ncbi:MAG: DNA replication and repair protein RecF [Candidatus Mesenet longicola]|uniref:DNA replication and repair protein RecF n=1 Tax=Candidatus Mesenet longicola TaxID=1892558 RepID=A0A8J3HP39_9RICK|nr:MAG: DNA replication and repair protein RecF [Candidatus Mesenet longicola]GHM59098.1 MAG: DNA replication and repair protein RecF [Candidatus Mesenet longicola]